MIRTCRSHGTYMHPFASPRDGTRETKSGERTEKPWLALNETINKKFSIHTPVCTTFGRQTFDFQSQQCQQMREWENLDEML